MFITNKQTNKQLVQLVVVESARAGLGRGHKEDIKEDVSLNLVRKAWCNTSFSYSAEDIPIIQEIEKIAKDDGFSFSQLVMRQLKDLYHARKPAQTKEQTQLEPFIENPEFRSMPGLLDPFKKWKVHIDNTELQHMEKGEIAARAIANYYREAWKRKDQQARREKIAKAAAAERGEITQ